MRRIGLGLMLGFGLAAGGTGVGWLAAMLEASEKSGRDVSRAEPAVGPASTERDAPTSAVQQVEDTEPLRAAADRTDALAAEIARLRWRIAAVRRLCRPEATPSPLASAPEPRVSDATPMRPGRTATPGRPERPAVEVAAGPDIVAVRPVRIEVERETSPGTASTPRPEETRPEADPTRGPSRAPVVAMPTVPPPTPVPEREPAPVRVAAAESPTVATRPLATPPQGGALGQPAPRAVAPVPPTQPPVPNDPVAMVAPPAPVGPSAPLAPPELEPLYRPGQPLSVPEEAVRSGDLSFLDGCWLSEAFDNPVNGNASTKIYCFDANGNGQMSFRGVDGITCRVDVRARWEPGRRLVLDEPQDGTCGSVGPWHREITDCVIGGGGLARCNSYEFYRQFNYDTRMTRI